MAAESDKYILRSGAIDAIKRNAGTLYTREAEFLLQKVIFLLKNAPAADVADVVHGTPVTEVRTRTIVGYHEEIGVLAGDRSTLYRKNMVHADIPYDNCPICGATLCSRWHNFCGKCGAKMDGGIDNVSD